MNFHDELELLIRAGYPVLTIISNKQTQVRDVTVEAANKRRKTSSSRAEATHASTVLSQPDSVHGVAKRKNWPALVGRMVK
jgi:hypothetical protein